MDKIKVLFLNYDSAGVNYFRTQTPAVELESLYGEEFEIDIDNQIDLSDPNNVEKLKKYNIVHYHQRLVDDPRQMVNIKRQMIGVNIKFILDIDDYWHLHPRHPLYNTAIEHKLPQLAMEHLKLADYVTTTTEEFAVEIKKVTGKDNVFVLYNSVDPEVMQQFEDNWKPDPNGIVRITYAAGSSHLVDVEKLDEVFNALNADNSLTGKFILKLAGWDSDGQITTVSFNEELVEVLKKRNMWTKDTVKILNKTKGNIDILTKLPDDIKDKFRDNVFLTNQRPIKIEESVYYHYEEILTNKFRYIKNKDYLNWLKGFSRTPYYGVEDNYCRRWTQKANIYAKVLDETDIVIAPLADNMFNRMKSNLKQVECWSRKLPIVCTDIVPYNVDGRHMENCILIPNEKNQRKHWIKYLKKLILDADLRKKLGEQLYADFSEKYNLKNVTKTRADIYKSIVNA